MQEKKETIFSENLKYFQKMEKKWTSQKIIFCFANTKYSLKFHSKAGNIVDETSEYKKGFGIFTCFLPPIENVIRPVKYFTFLSAYIYALSWLRVKINFKNK